MNRPQSSPRLMDQRTANEQFGNIIYQNAKYVVRLMSEANDGFAIHVHKRNTKAEELPNGYLVGANYIKVE